MLALSRRGLATPASNPLSPDAPTVAGANAISGLPGNSGGFQYRGEDSKAPEGGGFPEYFSSAAPIFLFAETGDG